MALNMMKDMCGDSSIVLTGLLKNYISIPTNKLVGYYHLSLRDGKMKLMYNHKAFHIVMVMPKAVVSLITKLFVHFILIS